MDKKELNERLNRIEMQHEILCKEKGEERI